MIRYLQRNEIDAARWDLLISSSPFEMIYPYTWYLDSCTSNWSAFVKDDYQAVMPVPVARKYSLTFANMPVYCQQLGVFSEDQVTESLLNEFMCHLRDKFSIGFYALNEGNGSFDETAWDARENKNHLLNLNRPFNDLRKIFNQNCRRNIKKAVDAGLEVQWNESPEELVALKKKYAAVRFPDSEWTRINNHFANIAVPGKLEAIGVRSGQGDLLAGVIFVSSRTRSYYLLSASSPEGKEQRAMFLLVEEFIRKKAGSKQLLDFEGSSIGSVARFFEGFGATPATYKRISYNTLANRIYKKIKGV